MDKEKRDIYQELTDKVIASIEQGVSPWQKGWNVANGGYPCNHVSNKNYNGMNVVLLMMQQAISAYPYSRWLTYKQAAELGGNVKKGEKGTHIVFYKTLEKENKETGDKEKIPMLRSYVVFNIAQCEGIDYHSEPLQVNTIAAIDHAENVFLACDMELRHGGSRAYWHSLQDYIQLPERNSFVNSEEYYATLFHETAHATAFRTRLDRKPYKSDHVKAAYAFEEAIAELSALFTCAQLGIHGNVANHASYIDGWLSVIRADKRAIFKAAAAAQKATDWVLDKAGIELEELDEAA